MIAIPTLILHRTNDPTEPIESGRFLAERIPNATLIELPGEDALPWIGDTDAVLDEIELVVTGSPRLERPASARTLATVLFTDIVGSTQRAAEIGDGRWRELLEEHDHIVRRELERYRGREIATTGDGFLATFDGPARAIACAGVIAAAVHDVGIEIRAGLHTGEVQTISGKVGGIAVHIGARVADKAGPSEVLVTQTVKDLVAGSGLVFEDTGEHELQGVPDRWHLYRVADWDQPNR